MSANRGKRLGVTLSEVALVLVLASVLMGIGLAAVGRARAAANEDRALDNLRQLALALHSYHDVFDTLPSGVDSNGFSAATRLLPYLDQDNVFKKIDFDKLLFAEANNEARKTVIPTFLSPEDPIRKVMDDCAPTNYLYNDKIFFLNSRSRIPVSFADGTSSTIVIGETLKGDPNAKEVTVQRKYVVLPRFALTGLKPDAGVNDFKAGKNIGGDRCGCWMSGRFLQGTFNGELGPNDERPDVSCGGVGGLSSARTLGKAVRVALGDGSARAVGIKVSEETWKNAMNPSDGNLLGPDWE
jgi:hypothetical protein